ncbi:hypothetical protein QJQ45_011729 [Haematococcus lacustris]|nr:hypothetical protein QJQ45_011729 [Haematococcus lacustris]
MELQLVVAACRNGLGIGKGGVLPWKLPGDMAYFKQLTTRTRDASKYNAVIMGRKTWDSIPSKFRPLHGRINVVLSRSAQTEAEQTGDQKSQVHWCNSIETAQELLASPKHQESVESVFVIGGGQIYREALASPHCTAIHLTLIDKDFDCDTTFPEFMSAPTPPAAAAAGAAAPAASAEASTPAPAPAASASSSPSLPLFRLWSAGQPIQQEDGTRYTFMLYTRPGCSPPGSSSNGPGAPLLLPPGTASQHEEYQYLELAQRIITSGVFRPDRTGTGTYSLFGTSMRFNLRHSFPLLTTKRVFWRGVAEELLWFVAGSTNANRLRDKGVHIWDGNSSREYLDSLGLTNREEGDLGPVYGFQWRHFGAEYSDMHADYSGQGVDQLAQIIERIKSNPYDRRLVMTAWNPAALHLMALPPCHMFCQFYVAEGELSCLMYQRSCDLGLGVPFNIASYALLTRMVAQVCGLQPGEFVHMMGDTHVYANHVEPLKEQLRNTPRHFPTLQLNPAKTSIDSFTMDDFTLLDYQPHAAIKMKMAV